jgi:hypothetical protein
VPGGGRAAREYDGWIASGLLTSLNHTEDDITEEDLVALRGLVRR